MIPAVWIMHADGSHPTRLSPKNLLAGGPEGEIEIRQVFELDELGEGPAVDRARELEKELSQKKE